MRQHGICETSSKAFKFFPISQIWNRMGVVRKKLMQQGKNRKFKLKQMVVFAFYNPSFY